MSKRPESIARGPLPVLALSAAAALALGFFGGVSAMPAAASHAVVVDHLEEDEPGWDCRIHGNKICGGK